MINKASIDQLEEAIDSFEENWSTDSRGEIPELLDGYGLEDDPYAITELIRIDIELRYKQGQVIQLEEYFDEFGELLKEPACIAQIAFEDFRSRYVHGHPISPTRWRHLPGIRNEIWFQQLADQLPADRFENVREMRRLPQADLAFQTALEEIGFRLVHEIGQGALSRVYLATQQELAGRYVVLKVVNKPLAEPQSMAMLQHTNIVPIYSFHRILSHSVICMPYAGSVTLEDFLRDKANRDARGGESLVVTVRNRVSDTTITGGQGEPDSSSRPLALIPAADEQAVLKPLDQLSSLGCNELAVWMFGRLASALAHSHARGVLHGDLKPGNVLIRNDGEPALLDFNLSQTLDRPNSQLAGGTLPYMAPESLRALMGQSVTVDSSSDTYGLGVMLFEFVTGRLPYPAPRSAAPIDLQPAISARKVDPVWREQDNVSPGLRAIIDRALAPKPEQRYGSAEQLQQDLEREQDSLSLVHASEPRSWRIRKWMHRHPRLISSGSISAMLLALLVPLGLLAVDYRNASLRLTAAATFDAFADESTKVLSAVMVNPRRHDGSVVDAAMQPLEKFGVLDGSGDSSMEAPGIPDEVRAQQRDTLLRHVVQVALAEADRLRPASLQAPLGDDRLRRLDQLISAADRICGQYVSRAVVFLRAERARLAGDQDQFDSLQAQGGQLALRSDNEKYLEAVRLMSSRQWGQAVEVLMDLEHRNSIPSSLCWTMIGRSQYNAGQAEEAKLSITRSIEHAPDASRLWFLRGLCYDKLGQYARAESDFSRVLELESTFMPAWLGRGTARLSQKRFQEGIDDLTQGLQYAPGHAQILINRSRAYRRLGMVEQADRDLAAAAKSENRSASSLYSRAVVLKKTNPEQALKVIEQAHQLEPERVALLTLWAHIYSYDLKDPDSAIKILDRAVELDPDRETAVVDRAVVLSQLGHFDKAKRDLAKAMVPPNYPRSLYQAACANALMDEEASHRRAVVLLAKAIQAGYQPDRLDDDPDLDRIRHRPGFRAVKQAYEIANPRSAQKNLTRDRAPR